MSNQTRFNDFINKTTSNNQTITKESRQRRDDDHTGRRNNIITRKSNNQATAQGTPRATSAGKITISGERIIPYTPEAYKGRDIKEKKAANGYKRGRIQKVTKAQPDQGLQIACWNKGGMVYTIQ